MNIIAALLSALIVWGILTMVTLPASVPVYVIVLGAALFVGFIAK